MKTFAMVRCGQRQSHPINFVCSGKGNLATTDLIQLRHAVALLQQDLNCDCSMSVLPGCARRKMNGTFPVAMNYYFPCAAGGLRANNTFPE